MVALLTAEQIPRFGVDQMAKGFALGRYVVSIKIIKGIRKSNFAIIVFVRVFGSRSVRRPRNPGHAHIHRPRRQMCRNPRCRISICSFSG